MNDAHLAFKNPSEDAVDAWRRDPSNTQKRIEELIPDAHARRVCLAFLAEAIVHCHGYGASRWSITLRHSRRIHLNLGRLLVWGIDKHGVWLGLHPDGLTGLDRAQLEREAQKKDSFRTAPQVLLYQVPVPTFVEIHERIKAAYVQFLDLAAQTAKQTPYNAAHSPGVVQYLREVCQRSLPDPHYILGDDNVAGMGEVDRVFWVYQGRNFDKERQDEFIFAGKADKSGKQPAHWKLLASLREGDILVHCVAGEIRALGRVIGPAEDDVVEFDGESRDGRRVDVEYSDLAKPIPLNEVIDDLAALEIPNGPFDANGRPNQGYLWRFSVEGLDILKQAREQPWPSWATPAHMPRAWIFQANPEKYNLRGALNGLNELQWVVKQYKREVRPGDTVYFWEAGPNGGVLAVGTILNKPEKLAPDPADKPFLSPGLLEFGDDVLQVRVHIDKRVSPPIGRARFKADPVLANCQIILTPQGTNFRVSSEQALALAKLVDDVAPGPKPPSEPPKPPPIPAFDALMKSIEGASLYYSDELVSHYLLALQAKRFVILTGISGTGKTQLALEVAKHFQATTQNIDNRAVIAVRPDWTDGRGLLGYYNAITQRYSTTPFLRLLLRAAEEQERAEREGRPAHPFFVILDEMNLARVEHYFSDFLSALESGEQLVLHDESALEKGDVATEEDDDHPLVPRALTIPPNLFFTGTVNIDETTHMFSPKVLDRAFVIELNDVDLLGYGKRAREQSALRLAGFRGLSRHGKPDTTHWEALGDIDEGALRNAVIELHALLTRDNRHFGFRVANEIARFIYLAKNQAPEHGDIGWTALDLAIVSKILPKLHGTQQELDELLAHLHAFTLEADQNVAAPVLSQWTVRGGRMIQAHGETTTMVRLPRAAAKLWRMRRRLERQGFTSFIE